MVFPLPENCKEQGKKGNDLNPKFNAALYGTSQCVGINIVDKQSSSQYFLRAVAIPHPTASIFHARTH